MMTYRFLKQRRQKVLISILGIAGITVWVLFPTLRWGFDFIDTATVIIQGILYSPAEYFTSPHSYQYLTRHNLTPWITFSLGLDYQLAGLEPYVYRLHHLMSFILMMCLIHTISLRLCKSIVIASIFTCTILLLHTTQSLAAVLVNRHYIDGMIFSILSVHCVLFHNTSGKIRWLLISAVMYGLATTAKEIYVPLPGILFFLIKGDIRSRLVKTAPYALVTIAYLAWRYYMLGNTQVGYSTLVSDSALNLYFDPTFILHVLLGIGSSLFGGKAESLLVIGIILAALVINRKKIGVPTWMLFSSATILIFAPLISLLPAFGIVGVAPRWFFLPTTALILLLAFLQDISTRPLKLAIICTTVLIFVLSLFNFDLNRNTLRLESLSKAILSGRNDAYIYAPRFNHYLSRASSDWVYLSKIHSDEWGTPIISHPMQNLLQSMGDRQAVDNSLRPVETPTLHYEKSTYKLEFQDESTIGNPGSSLVFSFHTETDASECFIYFFGEFNGLLFKLEQCGKWQTGLVELEHHARKIGYGIHEINIGYWQTISDTVFVSDKYPLTELMQLKTLGALTENQAIE